MSNLTPIQICAQDLRRQDRERYLCCLFLPQKQREAAFALYTFYHEVAKTTEVVSEAMLGQIRLQWWREALDEIYGSKTARRQPVVQGLHEAVGRHDLPKDLLLDLIDARENEVEGRFPTTPRGLEDHVVKTAGPLFDLLLRVAGEIKPDLAAQAARGYGILGILRTAGYFAALPGYDASRRLPVDQTRDLAESATEALSKARAERGQLSKTARRMLLPLCLADTHLRHLKSGGYDYCAPVFTAPLANPVLKLGWNAITNRY